MQDPILYLPLATTFVAIAFATVVAHRWRALTAISNGVGMIGAWFIAVAQLRVASSVYWNSVWYGLYMEDVGMGLVKPLFLGFAIVTIACHVGLRTSGGTQGVGRATTKAVVAGSVAVLAVDYFVTKLMIFVLY